MKPPRFGGNAAFWLAMGILSVALAFMADHSRESLPWAMAAAAEFTLSWKTFQENDE